MLAAARGFAYVAEHGFFQALSRAGMLQSMAAGPERDEMLEGLRRDEQTLRAWAQAAPENHGHRHALVEAELAAATGAALDAMVAYDRSIDLARKHGVSHHEAIANELCAKFHLQGGRTKVAAAYMAEAYHAYLRWGGARKAQALAD